MKNLWILTEERPKPEVICTIVEKFAADRRLTSSPTDPVQILPIIRNGQFTFTYRINGIYCQEVNEIFVKSISGKSSFVDFLVFHQDEIPSPLDEPIYAI